MPIPTRQLLVSLPAILALVTGAGPGPAAGATQELPPSGEEAETRLAESPRHGEWVQVDAGGAGTVDAWLVYPERAENAPVVVVIHEIFGMTDWIRAVADAFASEGFIAIAPDMLSGKGPDGGGTGTIEDPRRAISDLDPDEVDRRIAAAAEFATALPAATDRYGVVGFCWGGSTTFRYATGHPGADGAVVYYGSSPEEERLLELEVPVLGLYGGEDARVNATIEPARTMVEEMGGSYDVEIYDGAGHGFLRAQEHPDRGAANTRAAAEAWERTLAFFRLHLES